MKDRLAQTPSVRVLGVGDPGPHSAEHFFFRGCPLSPAVAQAAQAVAEATHVLFGQSPLPVRQKNEAGEGRGFAVRQDHCFVWVEREAPTLQECGDPSSPLFELFTVGEGQRAFTGNAAPQVPLQNLVINGGKVA